VKILEGMDLKKREDRNLEIKWVGTQASGKGLADWFTGLALGATPALS
jgi:hypothetical protein